MCRCPLNILFTDVYLTLKALLWIFSVTKSVEQHEEGDKKAWHDQQNVLPHFMQYWPLAIDTHPPYTPPGNLIQNINEM